MYRGQCHREYHLLLMTAHIFEACSEERGAAVRHLQRVLQRAGESWSCPTVHEVHRNGAALGDEAPKELGITVPTVSLPACDSAYRRSALDAGHRSNGDESWMDHCVLGFKGATVA